MLIVVYHTRFRYGDKFKQRDQQQSGRERNAEISFEKLTKNGLFQREDQRSVSVPHEIFKSVFCEKLRPSTRVLFCTDTKEPKVLGKYYYVLYIMIYFLQLYQVSTYIFVPKYMWNYKYRMSIIIPIQYIYINNFKDMHVKLLSNFMENIL